MTESDEAASMTVTPRVLRTPELTGNLRAHSVRLPEAAQEASGIRVLGRTIRSIVYTTDIAIIPMMIRPNRTDNAFRLSFTKTIKPNIPRIINVTTLSIWAKSQGE